MIYLPILAKRIIILLFIQSFITRISCQDTLTLNECIEYANKHNFSLNQNQYQLAKSLAVYKQEKLNYLPTLNVEYNHLLSSGRSLNQELYKWENNDIQQGSMALTAELTIFQGLHKLINQKIAKSKYEGIRFTIEKVKLQLGLEIVRIYYEILLQEKNIEILELAHLNTRSEIERINEQIIAGSVSKSNLYELLAQSCKEQLQKKTLLTDRDKRYLILKKFLNWPSDKGFILDSDLSGFFEPNPTSFIIRQEVVFEEILSSSPFIKEKEYQKKALMYNIEIQKSLFFPRITAGASVSSRYIKNAINPASESNVYRYIEQIEDNQFKQLALSLTIPIFSKNQTNTNLKLARLEYEALENEKKMVIQALENELLMIRADIESLWERIEITENMMQAFERSYEAAREKFAAGLLNSYELTLAKSNYTGTLLEMNRIRVEYNMNLELLKLYGSDVF